MSERRPFKEVKLQWLELLSCDAEVNDSAKCVALYIITKHMNGHTEEAWPSFSTIAEATGKSVKTIQRAIHDLELGGWLDVVRGNGSRRSTRYRPSEASILQASDLREKTDKIVPLRPSKGDKPVLKGGQICPSKGDRFAHQTKRKKNIKNLTRARTAGRVRRRGELSPSSSSQSAKRSRLIDGGHGSSSKVCRNRRRFVLTRSAMVSTGSASPATFQIRWQRTIL